MYGEEITQWIAGMKQEPPPPPEECHNCLDNPAFICCSNTWCDTHYHVHKYAKEEHSDFYNMKLPPEREPRGGETLVIE